ncbi:hypothetical protein KIPB_013244, partial [Kipferlia bialata]
SFVITDGPDRLVNVNLAQGNLVAVGERLPLVFSGVDRTLHVTYTLTRVVTTSTPGQEGQATKEILQSGSQAIGRWAFALALDTNAVPSMQGDLLSVRYLLDVLVETHDEEPKQVLWAMPVVVGEP